MKKYILSILFFIFGLVLVSIIKNETRSLQKEVNLIKISIEALRSELHQTYLDYNYLTSPENIMNLVMQNLDIDLSSYEANQIKKLHINNNYNENLIFKITKK